MILCNSTYSKKSVEFNTAKNIYKNAGHPLFGGGEKFSLYDNSGNCPKIDISFAYQKYPIASPVGGKSFGKK